ncbi:hypothetical protein ACFXI8_27175 [Streptomyces niveus]|uniref:hypothetical protein n=1 Tax=Streptomyces niveus TaxID=193462 RepID=UPI00367E216D
MPDNQPVTFEQPGHPVPRSPDAITAFASALREQPGQWALFGTHRNSACARQNAYQIRTARGPKDQVFAPAGSFETLSRTLFGEHRVYVRFVGATDV